MHQHHTKIIQKKRRFYNQLISNVYFTQSNNCKIVTFPCDAAKCNNEELISSVDNFLCAKISITV